MALKARIKKKRLNKQICHCLSTISSDNKTLFGQVLNFHGDNFVLVLWVHVNGSRLRNQKSALNQNSVNSFYTSLQILNPPYGAGRCARGAKSRCLANHSSRLKPTYSIGYVFCSFSLIVSLEQAAWDVFK